MTGPVAEELGKEELGEAKPENGIPADKFRKFISTTVHHLREPVRTIGIYAEMLRTEPGDTGHSLEMIAGAGQKLQRLLDSLSELAAVSASDTHPRSTIPLDLAVRQAMLHLDAEAKASNAKITAAALPEVEGNFDQLCLALRHLLCNALHYRGEAAPEIGIEATRSGDEWLIEVNDNGPGIPPEYRERVFDLYSRLHGSERPGSGLGLAVCRAVIENHGGTIRVESSRSGGAALRFTLPA
jgi:signal transduction histidine kinase